MGAAGWHLDLAGWASDHISEPCDHAAQSAAIHFFPNRSQKVWFSFRCPWPLAVPNGARPDLCRICDSLSFDIYIAWSIQKTV